MVMFHSTLTKYQRLPEGTIYLGNLKICSLMRPIGEIYKVDQGGLLKLSWIKLVYKPHELIITHMNSDIP